MLATKRKVSVMEPANLRTLHCAHCYELIGDYDFDEKYVTRKLYPTMRNFWPFHVDYSHYSGRPVFVHQSCRKNYYTTRFHGELYEILADYKCPDCKASFSEKNFYISRDKRPGGFIHRRCVSQICAWCKEVIGVTDYLHSRPYYFHKQCCFEFCDKRSLDHDLVRVDVDSLWPDNFNPVTACRYPPEFLVTARTFLLVIYRLGFKHLINRDMICLIMNYAVSPKLYPVQHGLELRCLPWVRGGSCYRCKDYLAFTRFDKDCCTQTYCRGYTDNRCPRGHNIRRGDYKLGYCTVYRCNIERCKTCGGSIRCQKNLELELCSREACNFLDEKLICFCGQDLYKEKTPEGRPNILPAKACLLEGRCAYLLKDQFCSCGDNLFLDFDKSFRCSAGVCRRALREILEKRLKALKP